MSHPSISRFNPARRARRSSSIGVSPPPVARSSTRTGRPFTSFRRANRAIAGHRTELGRLTLLIRLSPCKACRCSVRSSPGWSINSGWRQRLILEKREGKSAMVTRKSLSEGLQTRRSLPRDEQQLSGLFASLVEALGQEPYETHHSGNATGPVGGLELRLEMQRLSRRAIPGRRLTPARLITSV